MDAVSVVGEDLRETSDGPRLVGGRCEECGTVAFPRPDSCARCTGTGIVEHLLASEGTLWTFTIQGFLPKEPYDGPEEFEPYGVGYIDLGGELLVEARLTESDESKLAIGDHMKLVTQIYGQDSEGVGLKTFAFSPIGDVA